MTAPLMVAVESYVPGGAHHMWNPSTGRLDPRVAHRDWRYRITVNGLTIYRRQGFCSYERAVTSVRRNFPEVAWRLGR